MDIDIKKEGGRRKKLDRALIKEISGYIAGGLSNKDACALCDISEPSFYNWLNEARKQLKEGKKNSIYIEFFKSIKKAEVDFKAYHIQNIAKQARDDWKASAWTLERRYPKEYGKIDRVVALMDDNNDKARLDKLVEAIKLASGKED